MKLTRLFLGIAMTLVPALSHADGDELFYSNPVLAKNMPDPTVVKGNDGYYYLYATSNYVNIYRSSDMVNWRQAGSSFNNSTRPYFVEGAGIWAPDVSYHNGKYIMHYSMSKWGGEWECGIGTAVADSPAGPFRNAKKLFISSEIGVQNSIDPFFIHDDDSGKNYLFWGSFRGIYAIELTEDGLEIAEGAEKKKVAGGLTEGTYIHKHGDYYYMFGSAGTCCDGANSSYHLVVARSRNILGPYVDKTGKGALNDGFTTILRKSSAVVGPGHCSEIITDDAGQDWIFYHGYMAENTNGGRVVFMDRVHWDSEGWPYFTGDKPSTFSETPVVGDNPSQFTYSYVDYIDYQGEDANFMYYFDTGYVPTKNTQVKIVCETYSELEDGTSTKDKWRAICSGRSSYADGMSLYVNPEGTDWGFFMGGYKNNNIAPHVYNEQQTVRARLKKFVVGDQEVVINRSNYTKTHTRMTIFSGTEDYPYYGRIYSFQIYESGNLVHDYIPMLRNEDEVVGFFDRLSGEFLTPSVNEGFSYGTILESDGIETVNKTVDSDYIYDLQGRRIDIPVRGAYVKNGKIILN